MKSQVGRYRNPVSYISPVCSSCFSAWFVPFLKAWTTALTGVIRSARTISQFNGNIYYTGGFCEAIGRVTDDSGRAASLKTQPHSLLHVTSSVSLFVYPDRVFIDPFLGTSEDPHNAAWLTLRWGRCGCGLSMHSWFSHGTVRPFTGHCGMSASSVSGRAGHPLSEGQVLFPSSPL